MTVWQRMNNHCQPIRLVDICLLITDGKHGDCENQPGSGYYFLSAKDIKNGNLIYEGARQITKNDYLETHQRTQLEPNDVLISNSGTIGSIAIVKNTEFTFRTTFQKSVAILKPNKTLVEPKWLYYCLSSNKDRLINTAVGTAQKNLLLRDLRDFKINVPDRQIQRKIAAILSAYDDLIENNTRRIRILEEMAQSIYREWFVHFRYPGHEGVPLVDSPLGPIPQGWEVKKLGEECLLVMGQSPESKYYNENGEGLPFHQGVTGFGFRFPKNYSFCTKPNRIAENEDILFSVRAPVGRINISREKIIIGRGLCAIRSQNNNQRFVFQQLKEKFQEEDTMGGGTIFKSVTKDDMKGIMLLMPTTAIIQLFEKIATPIFKELEVLTDKNANLRQQRDLLLPRLMSGEVDVEGMEIPIRED